MRLALMDEVTRRYAVLDEPSWPCPRDPTESPQSWEYSRVTDPARYDALLARRRVWAEVLCTAVGAQRADTPAPRAALREAAANREVLLRLPTDAAPPIWFLERFGRARDGLVAAVEIAVGEPRVSLGRLPMCGCDACDDGSDRLLEEVDELVLHAISPFVALRGEDWSFDRGVMTQGSGGRSEPWSFSELVRLADSLLAGEQVDVPDDARVLVSQGWGCA
ncbi:DUF6226 family protein [Serinicoccus chungangensis]|nr:DUF6226 family protein [Serinicoccus chungangensis]